jgi:hypothetical protein
VSAITPTVDAEPIYAGPESTLLSWNGTTPESPDGRQLCYTRMPRLSPSLYIGGRTEPAELWVCDADLGHHRRLFSFHGENHNGSRSSWVDDRRIVFSAGRPFDRDYSHLMLESGGLKIDAQYKHKLEDIHVVDAESARILHGPICGDIGHYPAARKVFFSVDDPQLQDEVNRKHDAIDETGLYELDCDRGRIRKIVPFEDLRRYLLDRGYTEPISGMSHVMPNPSATRLMTRWDMVRDGRKHQALISHDMNGEERIMTESAIRPFHQLWFDDETYFAVSRGAERRIRRYAQDGSELELLGGVANHPHANGDRSWYVTDSSDRLIPLEIWLYARGQFEPAAVVDRYASPTLTYPVWSIKCHANPAFSRDGRSIYYIRPVERDLDRTPVRFVDLFRVEAVRLDVSAIVGR